jgi:hypothetical protein
MADRQAPRLRSQGSRTYGTRRLHPISTWALHLVRPRVESLPTAVSGQRHGDLAILPHVDAGHADLGDLSRRYLECERGEPCVVLVDSREPAYVSHPAGASAIFPPSVARHGSGTRHPVPCSPQSTRWEGCRPVRDAAVDGSMRSVSAERNTAVLPTHRRAMPSIFVSAGARAVFEAVRPRVTLYSCRRRPNTARVAPVENCAVCHC